MGEGILSLAEGLLAIEGCWGRLKVIFLCRVVHALVGSPTHMSIWTTLAGLTGSLNIKEDMKLGDMLGVQEEFEVGVL